VQVLSGKGFDFVSHVKKRVGNGQNTKFCLDTWILDSPLSVRFPRLFSLDSDKQVSIASKWAASGFNASFRREIRDGTCCAARRHYVAVLYLVKSGNVMDIEESPSSSSARKRLCIMTSMADNILETFKVIFKGKVYSIRAKELFTWTPCFLEFKESG
nr:RNA-directed DNA polymerase, eukaryota, reverse transcriptase zinc-binding domain protein [Tanacetum cinerariifolium]